MKKKIIWYTFWPNFVWGWTPLGQFYWHVGLWITKHTLIVNVNALKLYIKWQLALQIIRIRLQFELWYCNLEILNCRIRIWYHGFMARFYGWMADIVRSMRR